MIKLPWLLLCLFSLEITGGELGVLTYEIADGQVVITDCDQNAAGELDIPLEIQSRPVFSISDGAFEGCKMLSSLNLPSTITELGAGAFKDCLSLKSLTLPSGITALKEETFKNCTSLSEVLLPTALTVISGSNSGLLPPALSGVKFYRQGAFHGCTNLEKVHLPNSLRVIDGSAFAECTSLTTISLPQSLKRLGRAAFGNCKGLRNVFLNNGLEEIFSYCFSGCSVLEEIQIPDSVNICGLGIFQNCTDLKNVTLSKNCPIITFEMFDNCEALLNVHIPDGVERIDHDAFKNCNQLEKASIPGTIDHLDISTRFRGCNMLTTIEFREGIISLSGGWPTLDSLSIISLPYSLKTIYRDTFFGLKSLKSISIPQNVSTIGDGAFSGCENLSKIYLPEKFHSRSEANRIGLPLIYPDGFFLPITVTRTPELSIRLPLQLILKGDQNTQAVIEATESLKSPWIELQTVVIGEEGTTEVDLDEGAEKRFYRIRD